ncbi:MTOR-associated protein MEAK7-like [Xenia sp. Carnegie-2017]|uniref:MTOR-associated protein MEAK7-like n=1 Tax=Xenia sp. Carnegie-2017 TaxID=2897299 RepID=UPI001F036F4F|nr:MTOR-associated protein MEAK7-like [Xenia sp. Carnegie-2017]
MGTSSSRDAALEQASERLEEAQLRKVEQLFEKLSTSDALDRQKFKDHFSNYFPENFTDRIFNGMSNFQSGKLVESVVVKKRDFIMYASCVLKGFVNEKAEVFHKLSLLNNEQTLRSLREMCNIFLKAYINAIKESSLGDPYMNAGFNEEGNLRFVVKLTDSIPPEKQNQFTTDDLESWLRKEVLVMRIFEEVFKACFLGAESVLNIRKHGSIVRSDTLLPHQLKYNGHHEINTIIDIPSMLILNHAVPQDCRQNWRLLFATSCHGKSFTTFLHRIVYQGATILIVKDTGGYIFGGFASTSWKVKSSFKGDEHCFLFQLKPTMAIYLPTNFNENYMYLNVGMKTLPNGLGMGGQLEYFGFWLDSEFGPGHSMARPKSTTYGNPQLSSSEKFEVEEIEVWGVGTPPEQEERERSVLDRETDAQAILDLIGKERQSEGFREPESED